MIAGPLLALLIGKVFGAAALWLFSIAVFPLAGWAERRRPIYASDEFDWDLIATV